MEEVGRFLLGLYGEARERKPEEFRDRVLSRLRLTVPGSAAFWGDARRVEDTYAFIPTTLHVQDLDSSFLLEWATVQHDDLAIPFLLANPGRVLRVNMPRFHRPKPQLVDIARRYGLQAMNCVLIRGLGQNQVHWLSLFNSKPDAVCSTDERGWLEFVMPHLTEAWRINEALNAPSQSNSSGNEIGIAETSSGLLVRADAGLLAMFAAEWSGFDGRHVPSLLSKAWQTQRTFTHLARYARFDGRRFGELVYLSARVKKDAESLTSRQLDIADLFAQGLSNKEIARLRKLSPSTVRNHLAHVYEVLGVHGRIEMTHRLGDLMTTTRADTTYV